MNSSRFARKDHVAGRAIDDRLNPSRVRLQGKENEQKGLCGRLTFI
jgi:hypothetical protein